MLTDASPCGGPAEGTSVPDGRYRLVPGFVVVSHCRPSAIDRCCDDRLKPPYPLVRLAGNRRLIGRFAIPAVRRFLENQARLAGFLRIFRPTTYGAPLPLGDFLPLTPLQTGCLQAEGAVLRPAASGRRLVWTNVDKFVTHRASTGLFDKQTGKPLSCELHPSSWTGQIGSS